MNTVTKVSLIALGIIVVLLGVYLLVNVDSSEVVDSGSENTTSIVDFSKVFSDENKEVAKKILWGLLILAGIGGVIWLVVWLVGKKKKDDKQDVAAVKIPVNMNEWLPEWKKQFCIYNRIPFRYQLEQDKDNPPPLYNEELYFRISNTESFSDPSTGDDYCIFEVLCNQGLMPGVHVFIVKTDRGVDWVKNNWNWRKRERVSLNAYKHDFRSDIRDRPLNTLQSNQERLLNSYFEKWVSGEYDQADLEMYNQLTNKLRQTKPVETVDKKKKGADEPTSDTVPVINFTGNPEDVDLDDVNAANERYRRSKE